MNLTITIPYWLLWVAGGLCAIPVIYLMVLGILFIKFIGKGRRR